MATISDATLEFKRRMQAQIADALANVNFHDQPIQPGLHLRDRSLVSMSWIDRVNTLRRVELMKQMVGAEAEVSDRSAA